MPSSGSKTAASPERLRRRYPRYRVDFPVVVSLLEGDQYRRLDGHCRDLSQAGIGILLATELNGGEVASLSFSLPNTSQPWEVRAVVRHRRGYHYGFEFLSLGDSQARWLKDYLAGKERAD